MKRKIIVAPDSFKGSISAQDAANAIREGLLRNARVQSNYEVLCVPIADGGEGTLEALTAPAQRVEETVTGPDGKPAKALWGANGSTAIIEMARAAGLTMVPENERNAATATTFGVGELILRALDAGYRQLLLTVGGSATNDGGCGMLAALGARFLHADGSVFVPTGGTLCEIASIDASGLDPRLKDCHFTVATDVRNPLLGETGATRVYGRQKGADDAMLDRMEAGMAHYAALLEAVCGKAIASVPGCGAGGGLAAPLIGFADTRLRSGIEAVLNNLGFDELLRQNAALVITGEGKIDRQSLFGKAISGVAKAAARNALPVYCFVGCIGDDKEVLLSMGVRDIFATADLASSPEDSMRRAGELLTLLAERFAEML